MTTPTTPLIRQLVWVFLAGGCGASLRVALGEVIDSRWGERLPYVGTLAVNMIGCLAIGFAAGSLPTGTARTAIIGGLLGGFTTYSAFALLSYDLIRDDRIGVLVLQVATHVVVGIVCVWVGLSLARAIVGPGPS